MNTEDLGISAGDAVATTLNPGLGILYDLAADGYQGLKSLFGSGVLSSPIISNPVTSAASTFKDGLDDFGDKLDDATSQVIDALPTGTEVVGGGLAIGVFIIIVLVLALLILGKVDAL